MQNIYEYLMNKSTKDIKSADELWKLDELINNSHLKFEFSKEELVNKICDYVASLDHYLEKSHIRKIESSLKKVSPDIHFTSVFDSDDDETSDLACDIETQMQRSNIVEDEGAHFAKDFEISNEDFNIKFEFIHFERISLYIILVIDMKMDSFGLFVGK